jgi:hypothetical protein
MKKRQAPVRPPLTLEELERLNADDFVRLKLSEDEKVQLRRINGARQQERLLRSARLRVEEEPILVELRGIGWDVDSVWDFLSLKANYSAAIGVLVRHLTLPYSDRIREGIARALAVPDPEARKAWPILVAEYRKAPIGRGVIAIGDVEEFRLGFKDGLAVALSRIATEAVMEELVGLTKDRSHGESRVLLLRALRKSKSAIARLALDELSTDPVLKKEIASWHT